MPERTRYYALVVLVATVCAATVARVSLRALNLMTSSDGVRGAWTDLASRREMLHRTSMVEIRQRSDGHLFFVENDSAVPHGDAGESTTYVWRLGGLVETTYVRKWGIVFTSATEHCRAAWVMSRSEPELIDGTRSGIYRESRVLSAPECESILRAYFGSVVASAAVTRMYPTHMEICTQRTVSRAALAGDVLVLIVLMSIGVLSIWECLVLVRRMTGR